MNENLIKRIGDEYLQANHKDGETFLHTDYNGTMQIPLDRFTNNRKCEVHFFKVV